jgi:hypothetical protein
MCKRCEETDYSGRLCEICESPVCSSCPDGTRARPPFCCLLLAVSCVKCVVSCLLSVVYYLFSVVYHKLSTYYVFSCLLYLSFFNGACARPTFAHNMHSLNSNLIHAVRHGCNRCAPFNNRGSGLACSECER